MSFETLRYETREKVAVITYDRQERRNAWNLAAYREVVAAVEQANADPEVGAIVLTHNGPVFCAGADFKAPPEPKDPVTGIRPSVATDSMAADTSWLHLMARSKPVITAITGQAIGLGVTHILAVDIRIGGRSSSYNFPFVQLGVMPELGCTALLPQLVGFGRAMDICLTAAKLDAEEAYRIGLISRLLDDDKVLDEAVALGNRLAGYSVLSINATKRTLLANALESDPNTLLKREVDAFVAMLKAQRAAKAASSA